MGAQYMNKGDVLFSAGDGGACAYYLEEGSMQYKQNPQTSPVRCEMVTTVSKGHLVKRGCAVDGMNSHGEP